MRMRDWASTTVGEGDQFSVDKLRDDMRLLATDMEQLLRATANQTGKQVAQVRARAEESLQAAKARIADAQTSALARTRAASKAADEYVRENPWQALAIASAAAIAIGFLLARSPLSDSNS
jgi:ElaB/YqjD/DUF883 family membrane-anchored ribosome-binding protein